MPAYGYEFYLRVVNSISHSFAALTREISSWPLEDKIHIHARACNILYFSTNEQESDAAFVVLSITISSKPRKGAIKRVPQERAVLTGLCSFRGRLGSRVMKWTREYWDECHPRKCQRLLPKFIEPSRNTTAIYCCNITAAIIRVKDCLDSRWKSL